MAFEEFFEMVDRANELGKLRRALGPWSWRVDSIRASGGKDLSERMTLLLALIVYDGYQLFPAMTPNLTLETAYHPIGRREFDRGSIQGLQKSLNHCHRVNQLLIKELAEKDKQIAELRRDKKQLFWLLTKSITITAGVTSLATIGLEYLMRMK